MPGPLLVVAAISARMLAECARAEGYEVIALDCFGDVDTRRASREWRSVGDAARMRIDASALLPALRDAAAAGAIGWVPGTGFEGDADLLARGAGCLPLIGTAAEDVRRVRDPRGFFARLDAEGIAYPAVSFRKTADTRFDEQADDQVSEPVHVAPHVQGDAHSWLRKDARGSGGWHICRVDRQASEAARSTSPGADLESGEGQVYHQQEAPGRSMSATFIGNGTEACVIGHNELIVRRFGLRPHVYCGAVGPVALVPDVAREVGRIVGIVTRAFRLRGLCSLDFLLDGTRVSVLEVNPRPPATMALHAPGRKLIQAHVAACLRDELPSSIAPTWHATESADGPGQIRGTRIVFARRALQLSQQAAALFADRDDCHDKPGPGARFETGDPVCTLSAVGDDPAALRALLKQRRDTLLDSLETSR